MRRDFHLPEDDELHLKYRGLPWDTVRESGVNWLLIHGWRLPPGYTHPQVILAVRITEAYPPGKLDMVYVYPPLARADGRAINALTPHVLDGKTFQQWSRHYEWVPGEHDLTSHLACAEHWFASELRKG